MKLTIKGLKKLDATTLATTIEQWELGDIIAYGLESSRELPTKEPELTIALTKTFYIGHVQVDYAGKPCLRATSKVTASDAACIHHR